MASYGGWTGKTLRVNLSTGKISTEDTIERYKDYLGGTGVGYKVLWDEVPAKTGAFDEANKLVFGVGPLTGTGAPCGGRVSITGIFPTVYPVELVATGHMGGHWGPELKFAGWDNMIIEGKADKPVWLKIVDGKVEIKDAGKMWGNGIFRATAEICQEMGPDAHVAAIGQSGENMVRMSTIQTGNSHSAGGLGGVMGSKNLKAIGVKGTGSVPIVADKAEWRELVKYAMTLQGANNNHAAPSTPQRWAEYHHPNSRWTARKGLFWGAANPPVETGECHPDDMQSVGYRTQKAIFDLGPLAEQYTVRMGGCHACPIRCHVHIDVPSAEAKYGVSRYATNTCVGWWARGVIPTANYPGGAQGMARLEAAVVGSNLTDDYGIWCNYGLLPRDFTYAVQNGIVKERLSKAEYDSIPWDKYEKGDPGFLLDFLKRIAYKQGELGTILGEGSGRMAAQWGFGDDYYSANASGYWKMGHPRHHSTETSAQSGALMNMMYNRDAQIHSHINFVDSRLPISVLKPIAEKLFGSGDAIDESNNRTPMNQYKAKLAKWALLRKELHDSLTICNWMGPWVVSPHKERNYEGDNGLEAKLYSLATGDRKSAEELDTVAERVFNLHRALTIRDMGTKEMRVEHDTAPDWVFDHPAAGAPFTPGHNKMDRADMEIAKNMFYAECGWDGATGTPSRYTYERLGMKDVADGLESMGLL